MSRQELTEASSARPCPAERIERRRFEQLIPRADNARLHSEGDIDKIADANTVDQKTHWGLGEVVMWVRTRDYKWVAVISDLSETEAMVRAMFTFRMRLDPRSLLLLSTTNSSTDREAAASLSRNKSTRAEGPVSMPPDAALDDVQRKLRSGRLPLTSIKCGQSGNDQIPVPPAELNDLVFRFIPDHWAAPVGLWSRSRGLMVWRSPQFLRTDVTRVWPAQNTKTAAASGAILRHLRCIMRPEAPLTKLEAQRRCMAEVSNAYPEAFKRAWVQLETSFKRGRGKHGSRAR
jgi:hypothetical protein